jgi:hypothetical protein
LQLVRGYEQQRAALGVDAPLVVADLGKQTGEAGITLRGFLRIGDADDYCREAARAVSSPSSVPIWR